MNCEACSKSFTDIVPYTQHIKSEKHQRKMNSMNILGISNQIVCTACNITFDSVQSYHHHSLTLDHANNVIKNADKTLDDQNVSSVSSYSGNDNITADSSSHDQNLLSNNKNFQCKICNKKFIDQVTYLIHMECDEQEHLIVQSTREADRESNSSATKVKNTKNKFTCEQCKKVFTGQILYNQHLISDAHKTKLKFLQLLELEETEDLKCIYSYDEGIPQSELTTLLLAKDIEVSNLVDEIEQMNQSILDAIDERFAFENIENDLSHF